MDQELQKERYELVTDASGRLQKKRAYLPAIRVFSKDSIIFLEKVDETLQKSSRDC